MDTEIRGTLVDDQIGDLHDLYQAEWWTEDRELNDVREMIENSDEYFVVAEMVAFYEQSLVVHSGSAAQ